MSSSRKYLLQLFLLLAFPESKGVFRPCQLVETPHTDSTYTRISSDAADLTRVAW